jgi:hypothetical protein
MKLNPKLEVNDRVILLSMQGENMLPGTKGVVTRVSPFQGDVMHYDVNWENGRTLSLLSDTDVWKKDTSEQIKESEHVSRFAAKNPEIFKYFDKQILTSFLKKLRECGWVNMFSARPYLYMGAENIKKSHPFQDENEACEEMLEMADDVKDEMIRGTIKYLEDKNMEVTVQSVNRNITKMTEKIWNWYTLTFN